MTARIILATCVLIVAACAANPTHVVTPIELVGIVANPTYTGWYIDYCNDSQPTKSAPNCVRIGGDIYKANLLDAREPGGTYSARKLVIGFPAHALPKTYRERKRMRLEMAPDDFRNETGILYLATDWSDT